MAQEVLQAQRQGAGAEDPELRSALLALLDRLSQVVGGAQALTEAARQAGFEDIARQADSLRQQLLAARDKIASVSAVGQTLGRA